MLILALDTSRPSGSLAILQDLRVVREFLIAGDDPYSSRLFRHLDQLLTETKVELKDIDVYAVCAGPGSFTGLRVGLTAAKAWAEVFGKPIAAVSGLEAVAAQSQSKLGLLAPVLDARRGEVYGGLYEWRNGSLAQIGEAVVMPPREYLAWVGQESAQRPVQFVSPTPEILAGHLASIANASGEVETVSATLAPFIGQLGYAQAQRGELVDALTLDANYVRRTDAEVLWKTSA
jgi:tRNA threonylcarbamoyladenosine biosynthesis protein TsaB